MPTSMPTPPPPACDDDCTAPAPPHLQEVVALAQPSLALTSNHLRSLARHAMALKENLSLSAQRLLRQAQNSAMLCWYSNDTTPM
eukprot:9689731-Heterocapsa_arctica.AAC.1